MMKLSLPLCLFLLLGTYLHGEDLSLHEQKSCDCTQDTSILESPLFTQNEILQMTFRTDLKELLKDKRDERDYHPIELSYASESGDTIRVEAKSRVRGNFRRNMCKFPPLRIKFDSVEVVGTLFEGQDKLKLVTHCNNKKKNFEQYIALEHLIYQSYNLMTEKSFRVRLVKMRYEDTRGKYDPIVRIGFLIEPIDQIADRLGGVEIETKNLHPNAMHGETVDMLSVFEYMIGNTDWSIPGLHNVKIVFVKESNLQIPIPYDFDWSGTINAPYAFPNPTLNLSSIRERIYRGFCKSEVEFQHVFDQFLAKKEDILSLYQNSPYLEEKTKQDVLKYLNDFFETLEDPKRVKREFYDKCRTNR